MFNVGGGELLVIILIALIVLGPQRLPDAARQVGKVMGEVRRVSSGFQRELTDALDVEPEPPSRRKEPTPLAATVADAEAATGPVARTNGDHGDAGENGDDTGVTAPAAAMEDVGAPDAGTPEADEQSPPASPPTVAAPVADALDEIVAPLDDERAAS